MKKEISVYHRLPSALWPLAASIHALRLKRRRYGEIYRKALHSIEARMSWDVDQWRRYQNQQLLGLMEHARREVPAYEGRPGGKTAVSDEATSILREWPLLDMERFRLQPRDYLSRHVRERDLIRLHTSGTSGTPKTIYRDLRAEQLHYAYVEVRWRNTSGVRLGDRWVMIGGQLVVPVERCKPPFVVAAYPLGQLYASSYHLRPEHADAYVDAIEKWKPLYIWGYASSLHALAGFLLKAGKRLPLRCVLSNAEPLYDHVRERLREAFACDVRDTYGSTEAVVLGFECAQGRMHICPDYGVLEILRGDGTPCCPGELGSVVATGFTNRAMPMIRYPLGDMAAWSEEEKCPCGCSFPILIKVEGRCDDLIELPDGRVVGRLDPVFKVGIPLREAQIVQKRDRSLELLLVPELPAGDVTDVLGWRQRFEASLLRELRARVGTEIAVRAHYVQAIPRQANGKFRAVVRERE